MRTLSLLMFITFSLVGCGVKPRSTTNAPSSTAEVNTATTAASSQVAAEIDTGFNLEHETLAATETLAQVDSASSPTTAAPKTHRKAESEKVADTVSSTKEIPKLKKPEANPTEDQIEKWKEPEIEKLELLAMREIGKIGLITCSTTALDGKHFMLAGTKLTLWSPLSEAPVHTFIERVDPDQNTFISSIATAPNGKWFAAGDSEGTVRIWSLPDRKELIAKQIDKNDIVDIAISPDSGQIATISFNNIVSIWSADKLELKSKFEAKTNGVKRIEYMNAASIVVIGERSTLWNIGNGKLEKDLEGDRYSFTLAKSEDCKALFTASENQLRIWNTHASKVESTLTGKFASTELVVPSPDGQWIATANGSAIRIWDRQRNAKMQIMDAIGDSIVAMEWLASPNLLAVASDDGLLRIWGTTKNGEADGLRPVHKPMVKIAENTKVPASPRQLLDAVDLRMLPVLPGSTLAVDNEWMTNYNAPVGHEEAKLFYRWQLGQRGWMESNEPSNNPMSIEFRKDGFMLSTSFYDSGDGKTNVTVNHGGNFDLRWLPKSDVSKAELLYESENSVMYQSTASILEMEVDLLRKMHAAGLTAYSRLFTSQREEPDNRMLNFLFSGAEILVSISKMPNLPEKFSIQYSRFLTQNSLPIPPDSGFVEFDGSTKPSLVALTSMTLDETLAFYDRELSAQGWLIRKQARLAADDRRVQAYAQNQKSVVVVLRKLDDGKTQIRVGENLENSSWQLKKPAEEPKDREKVVGLEAADFPILNAKGEAKLDPREKSIEVTVEGSTLAAIAEKYTKTLADLGWQAEKGGIRAEDYTFFSFKKEKKEIALRAHSVNGNARVNFQGDGLLWTKPLPGAKPIVSYETWLRDHRHPAGLQLLETYQSEMQAIGK
jgi:WD40 repeat protein